MNTLATDYGGDIEATLTALSASSDPQDREIAAGYAKMQETSAETANTRNGSSGR